MAKVSRGLLKTFALLTLVAYHVDGEPDNAHGSPDEMIRNKQHVDSISSRWRGAPGAGAGSDGGQQAPSLRRQLLDTPPGPDTGESSSRRGNSPMSNPQKTGKGGSGASGQQREQPVSSGPPEVPKTGVGLRHDEDEQRLDEQAEGGHLDEEIPCTDEFQPVPESSHGYEATEKRLKGDRPRGRTPGNPDPSHLFNREDQWMYKRILEGFGPSWPTRKDGKFHQSNNPRNENPHIPDCSQRRPRKPKRIPAQCMSNGEDQGPAPSPTEGSPGSMTSEDKFKFIEGPKLNQYMSSRDSFTLKMFKTGYQMKVLGMGQRRNRQDKVGKVVANNLVFSPYSIWQALVLIYVISDGQLSAEMESELHLEGISKAEVYRIVEAMAGLGDSFKQRSSDTRTSGQHNTPISRQKQKSIGGNSEQSIPVVEMANRLYLSQDLMPTGPPTPTARMLNQELLQPVDFRRNSPGTRQSINDWVSQVTRGKIKDLLDDQDVDPSTELMLINAAYFKGTWLNPFLKNETEDACFFFNPERTLANKVPTMRLKDQKMRIDEIPGLGADLVELPYWTTEAIAAANVRRFSPDERMKSNLNLFLIVPHDADGSSIDNVVQRLSQEHLEQMSSSSSQAKEVKLFTMPKFEVKTNWDLEPSLRSLFLEGIFNSSKADFGCLSDLLKGKPIGKAKHEATIEVNEQGTEASAANKFLTFKMMSITLDEYRIDRPFIYAIVLSKPRTVLFMGVVKNPLLK